MTSVWDDPEIQVVNEYVKFEAVGDKVVGDVISVSKHTFAAEGNKPAKTVASIVIRTDSTYWRFQTGSRTAFANLR